MSKNHTFKLGGPIKATGAAIEKMENMISTSQNISFANTFKQTSTPAAMSSKMP
jgi:hypothetical protein